MNVGFPDPCVSVLDVWSWRQLSLRCQVVGGGVKKV